MTTAKNKKYRLAQVVAEAKDKHPEVDLEIAEGKTVTILPPQLWDEATLAVADDAVAITKKLLGDNYDAYIKAGGTVGIFAEFVGDAFGDLGKFSAS